MEKGQNNLHEYWQGSCFSEWDAKDQKPDLRQVQETEMTLKYYPFICGICEEKFDRLQSFYAHFACHEQVKDMLHCCTTQDSDDTRLFSCGICNAEYPTLCTLYVHFSEVEGIGDFIFKFKERVIHALKGTECEQIAVLTDKSVCATIKTETQIKDTDTDKMTDTNLILDNISSLQKAGAGYEDYASLMEEENAASVAVEQLKQITSTVINKSVNSLANTASSRQKSKKKKSVTKIKSCLTEHTNISYSKNSKRRGQTSQSDTSQNKGFPIHEARDFTEVDAIAKASAGATEGQNPGSEELEVQSLVGKSVTEQLNSRRRKDSRGELLYPCEICGAVFKHKYLLKHKTTHNAKTIRCDCCNNMYNSKAALNTHKKQVHTSEKKFICDECGKSFAAWPYLKQHRYIHLKERTLMCPLCPQAFRYKAVLRTHLKTHSEEKPHKCEQCGAAFKRTCDLTSHKKYHLAEKNFRCPDCEKGFTTRSDMRKHQKIHLPPTHFCSICGKPFTMKYNMRIHMKVHGIVDFKAHPC